MGGGYGHLWQEGRDRQSRNCSTLIRREDDLECVAGRSRSGKPRAETRLIACDQIMAINGSSAMDRTACKLVPVPGRNSRNSTYHRKYVDARCIGACICCIIHTPCQFGACWLRTNFQLAERFAAERSCSTRMQKQIFRAPGYVWMRRISTKYCSPVWISRSNVNAPESRKEMADFSDATFASCLWEQLFRAFFAFFKFVVLLL